MDCSPPSSSVHGLLQARILEWVAISFSRGSSRPRDRTQVSHIAGRCFNLCTTKEALKDFKGGKEARLKEGGGGGSGVDERGGLTDISCHLQIPRHYGTFPWASREGRTGTYQRLALSEIRPDQNQISSSLPRGGDQSPILSSG